MVTSVRLDTKTERALNRMAKLTGRPLRNQALNKIAGKPDSGLPDSARLR